MSSHQLILTASFCGENISHTRFINRESKADIMEAIMEDTMVVLLLPPASQSPFQGQSWKFYFRLQRVKKWAFSSWIFNISNSTVLSNPSIDVVPLSGLWHLQLEFGHSDIFMFLQWNLERLHTQFLFCLYQMRIKSSRNTEVFEIPMLSNRARP